MNLRQLEFFAKIAETKNYSIAARQYGVTQSCLSHAIQRLEEELECRLFYQNGRTIELTSSGKQLLPFIVNALSQLSNGIATIKHPKEISHKILINGYSALSPYITKLIVELASNAADIENKPQIQYSYEERLEILLESLLTEQTDFVFSDKIESAFVCRAPVGSRKYVLLTMNNHRICQQKDIRLNDLCAEKIITFPLDCYPGTVVRSCFERNGYSPRITAETTQNPIFYSMIQSGYGIAILPEPLSKIPQSIESISLSAIIPDQQIYIHWKCNRVLNESQNRFLSYILGREPGLQ